MESGQPLCEGGIFGHVKAFIACPETNGRGSLHVHYILWIHGFPIPEEIERGDLRTMMNTSSTHSKRTLIPSSLVVIALV